MPSSRRFELLAIADAVCWLLTLLTLVAGGIVGAFATALAVAQVLTPSAEQARQGEVVQGIFWAIVVGAALLCLVTVVLDVVVGVMALRRLGGRPGGRAVPIMVLVGIGAATVLPAVLLGLALGAGALELPNVALALWWLLGVVLLVPAPSARLTQLVGGIVAAVSAPRPASVGPLP